MDEDLAQSWRRTEQHLLRARAALGVDLELPWFDEFLAHNEFTLAFDVLVESGESAAAPQEFWVSAMAAAQEMHLIPDEGFHGKSAQIVAEWVRHNAP